MENKRDTDRTKEKQKKNEEREKKLSKFSVNSKPLIAVGDA